MLKNGAEALRCAIHECDSSRMEKMREPTPNIPWKVNRNQHSGTPISFFLVTDLVCAYPELLLQHLQKGKLSEPFDKLPKSKVVAHLLYAYIELVTQCTGPFHALNLSTGSGDHSKPRTTSAKRSLTN